MASLNAWEICFNWQIPEETSSNSQSNSLQTEWSVLNIKQDRLTRQHYSSLHPCSTTLVTSRLYQEKFRAVAIMLLIPLANSFTSPFIPQTAIFQLRHRIQIDKAWIRLLALTFLVTLTKRKTYVHIIQYFPSSQPLISFVFVLWGRSPSTFYKELSISRVIPGTFTIQIAASGKVQLSQSEIHTECFPLPKRHQKRARVSLGKSYFLCFSFMQSSVPVYTGSWNYFLSYSSSTHLQGNRTENFIPCLSLYQIL